MKIEKKLDYLQSCIDDGSWEDVLGHLGDLFHNTLKKLNEGPNDWVRPELHKDGMSLCYAVNHYILELEQVEDLEFGSK